MRWFDCASASFIDTLYKLEEKGMIEIGPDSNIPNETSSAYAARERFAEEK